jgi:site-specific DNA-methyltransferase (adenine-specific)
MKRTAQADIQHIGDLKLDPRNARKHNPRNVGMIVDSLHEVGAARSIVIDEEGRILAGNGTVDAAAEAGIERVQVVDADGETIIAVRRTGLTEAQKRRLALLDNRTAELAEWDAEVLAALAEDGINLDDLFAKDELDDLLADLNKPNLNGDPDDVPDEADVETRCKPGDLWRLGNHRLLCGDSTKAEDVARVMGGEWATHVFTDPPYRFETKGAGCFGPAHDVGGHSIRKTMNAISNAGLAEFEPATFLAALPAFFRDGMHSSFIFCSKDLIPDYLNWARANDVGFNVLVWKKTGGVIPFGNGPLPDVEYLLLFRRAAKWNAATQANRSKVLEYGRADVSDHPTPKPVALVVNQLSLTTEQGDIVGDPFIGSGTTLIAAETLGRRCYGIEIEPRYCDIVLARWENLTGKDAERIDGPSPA